MDHDQAKDPEKKHRHDIGHPDHGPISDEPRTRNIQVVLGLWIAGSLALTLYAVIQAAWHAAAS
ncbi:MAG TPA: hypothetical protein VNM90_16690 [Haliangium sp.]|nr:hypothetical protein [Haliangium sp.]